MLITTLELHFDARSLVHIISFLAMHILYAKTFNNMPHTAHVRFTGISQFSYRLKSKFISFLVDVDTKIIKMNKRVEFSGCLATVITIMIRLS